MARKRSLISFSRKEFERAIAHYREHWSLTDRELYDLCHRHPGHDSPAIVNAKLLIIGRGYATGIERKVRSKGMSDRSLPQISNWMFKKRQEIDRVINRLPSGNTNGISGDSLRIVLEAHGRFVSLLREVTKSQAARTFASKYLHFHRPLVPIFDSIASGFIPRMVRWNSALENPPRDEQIMDKVYYEYVMRLMSLDRSARETGLTPTIRDMDYYLLWEERAARCPATRESTATESDIIPA